MIAFLIDADNLSSPEWIEEAFQRLEQSEGSISVRRAYGSAENLKGLADTLRVWAIRPFVNLALPKNTTDMSLALDAMELACLTPRPTLVVVGSGDLDFVPLVVRLRERGIRIMCVSERSKMALDAVRAYDQVMYVGVDRAERAVTKVVDVPPVPPATKKAAGKANAMKKSVPKPVAAQKTPTPKAAKKPKAAVTEAITVPGILAAVPSLKAGQWQALSEVAKLLHDEKLLAKNATSTKLFKKFPHHFELIPAGKPNQVRFISPPQQ